MSEYLELIDSLYQAAVTPGLWPVLLTRLGTLFGAKGALFFTSSPSGVRYVGAPVFDEVIAAFVAEGWAENNPRLAPLFEAPLPGFMSESDVYTPEQRAAMPVFRDFLHPRAMGVAVATLIQGAHDDAVTLSVEDFGSDALASAAVPHLDRLRPHIARALTISARLADHEALAMVNGLSVIGTAAAVIDQDGRLRAANALFDQRLGNDVIEQAGRRLTFLDIVLKAQFAELLAAYRQGGIAARSIAVRPIGGASPFVLHVMPLRGGARELFGAPGLLLVAADSANASIPDADLLRLLFDLTPAEARLARRLAEGATLAEAGAALGVKDATVRSQLKAIFAKTGVSRQAELVRLLLGYGRPGEGLA